MWDQAVLELPQATSLDSDNEDVAVDATLFDDGVDLLTKCRGRPPTTAPSRYCQTHTKMMRNSSNNDAQMMPPSCPRVGYKRIIIICFYQLLEDRLMGWWMEVEVMEFF